MWHLLWLLPLASWLLIAGLLYFAQTAILFPTARVAVAGPPPPGSETLELRAPSGERLFGLHIPATQGRAGQLLILGFVGNASNAADGAEYLHALFPQADVAAFHYRGYRPSEGAPGAAAMQADALFVHDYLRERLNPERVVAVGISVGSGVAPYLARHRQIDGLILVTPFDSLAETAAGHDPWLPVRLLLRHRMEPAADLAGNRTPVAILAAERDRVIPPARTEALRRAVPNLVFHRMFAHADHAGIHGRADYQAAMREALQRVLDGRAGEALP